MVIQDDNSLRISDARIEDAGDYTCKAYNGIGAGASKTYSFIVTSRRKYHVHSIYQWISRMTFSINRAYGGHYL